MIRAVLDSNVLVSAVLKKNGNAYQVVAKSQTHYRWLISEFILEEIRDVLQRKHIQTRYRNRVTLQRRNRFLKHILRVAEQIHTSSQLNVIAEDPQDNPILACAVDGKAQYLVTGDPHLLQVGTFHEVRIVTPVQFLERVSQPRMKLGQEGTKLEKG